MTKPVSLHRYEILGRFQMDNLTHTRF